MGFIGFLLELTRKHTTRHESPRVVERSGLSATLCDKTRALSLCFSLLLRSKSILQGQRSPHRGAIMPFGFPPVRLDQ